jgi:hypothetical protein
MCQRDEGMSHPMIFGHQEREESYEMKLMLEV